MQYNITASMLNGFQSVLDAPITAEEFWNIDRETGEYKRTADEIALQAECDLINSINRCPREPMEAADRGTALNEIVDCMVQGVPSTREDTKLSRAETELGLMYGLKAEINGFEFVFDTQLCRQLRDLYKGSIVQHYHEAMMSTQYGDVMLYGYSDYWQGDTIRDLKTTKKYDFGKYERGWQRIVYPWTAIESGEAVAVDKFVYDAIQLSSRGGIIFGTHYPEEYAYGHLWASKLLRNGVCRFIEWIESRRDLITDAKVFGGENAPDYVGEKIEVNSLVD